MIHNGFVDVSPEALAIALSGRKIEAIKLCREQTNCGLKDAKDAVENAMVNATEGDVHVALAEARRQIERLSGDLYAEQRLRREDRMYGDRELEAARVSRNEWMDRAYAAEARVEHLEHAITDHVLGRNTLPSIGA